MESGRLDSAEMRLDMKDCVIFVRVVETPPPGLIRNINVGQRGEYEDHAHEQQDDEQASSHHSPFPTRFV
jgi:hypothetical protein